MTGDPDRTEPISPLGDTEAAPTAPVPSGEGAHVAGAVLGERYEILAQLGRGAHGAVFRALDRVAETEVALKILLDLRDDALALLRRELAAARRVTHRGVVRMFDLVELGEKDVATLAGGSGARAWALSMELIEGASLERELERGPVSIERLAELADALSDALGAAHEAGVVHRDLKPQNILVRPGGSPVITDFGVSRTSQTSASGGALRASAKVGVTLTVEGALLGTPLYMAPEQLAGRTDVGPPADVYGLGLILYEAATGRVPHEADSVGALRERRGHEPIPPVVTLRPEIPARLGAVIARCLEPEPAARFANGAAVYEALHPPKVSAVLSRRARGSSVSRLALGAVMAGAVAGGVIALVPALRGGARDGGAVSSPASRGAPPSASATAPARAPFALKPKNPRRLTVGPVCEEFPSFFPDGRRVAFDQTVGTKSHIVEIDLETGALRQLTSSPMWDFSPTVSPDGRTLAFVRAVGRVRNTQVLDVATGVVREISAGDMRPAFAPNGELWCGAREAPTRVDVASGEVRARLPLGEGERVARLVELADGSVVVAFQAPATYSTRAAAYDLTRGRWESEWRGDLFDGLAPSPDGREALLIAGDTSLARFSGGRFSTEDRSAALARVRSGLAISPRGDRVMWSTCDGMANLARIDGGQAVQALEAQRDWSNLDASFLSDGRVAFVSDRDPALTHVWLSRPGAAQPVEKLPPLDARIRSVASRGTTVVAATEAGLRLVDTAHPDPFVTLTRDAASDPEFDARGDVVYASGAGARAHLLRVERATGTSRSLGPVAAREPGPSPVDGRIVYVAGAEADGLGLLEPDGRARPFGKGLPKGTFSKPKFAPDARRVAVIHDLDSVLVIDVASERVIETHKLTRGSLDKPVFSPDGTLYVVSSDWLGDLWVADLE